MKMTEEGLRAFLTDPTSADTLIADTLEHKARADWPLPAYLLEHLDNLAAAARDHQPTQSQVDEARIPLKNWFRQKREDALNLT